MVRPKNCNIKRLQNFKSNQNRLDINNDEQITPELFLTRIHQYGYFKFKVNGEYLFKNDLYLKNLLIYFLILQFKRSHSVCRNNRSY
jgi:hypothetical protein